MSEVSFERRETTYNDFLLGYPANAYDQARKSCMDGAPSTGTFRGVIGAAAISAELQRVITEVATTRLDFTNIVNGLDQS